MDLRMLLGTGAVAAALAAPAVAAAAPTNLPAVVRTATAAAASGTSCTAGLRDAAGTDQLAYVAPATGFLSVRTAGGAGSDWDVALHDAATERRLAASQGFGSREVAQTWVKAGQRLVLQACRLDGASDTLQVRFELLKTELPKAGATPQLIEVEYDSFADLEALEQAGIDVTHQHFGGHADVIVAGAEQLGALRALGLDYEVEIADLGEHYRRSRERDAAYAAAVGTSPLPSGRTTYRTYEDYQNELKKLAEEHPTLVKPLVMPKRSVLGREVQGIEISRDVHATDDGKPVFFLMGVHHAREWPSAEISLEFAYELLKGDDPRSRQILRDARVFVVPIINPDGFVASRGAAVSPGDASGQPLVQTAEAIAPPGGILAYRRKNCGGLPMPNLPCELQYGIDPNRNYGEGWGGNGAGSDINTQSYRGPGPWSEPETQGVHELSQRRQVTGLITLHTVGALVLRPPGRSFQGKAPDENETKRIGDYMSAATGYPSQYFYQLYDTAGTTEDWNYAAAGTYGYTIEIGPSGGQFHMAYQTGVVDQWTGTGERQGRGLREALLYAASETTDESTHGVLEGTAPAGAVLRVRRDFKTKTSAVCTYAQGYINQTGFWRNLPINCLAPGAVRPAEEITDFVDTTTVVGADGTFEWHVGPSTRPFVGARYDDDLEQPVPSGVTEAWKLTCETPDGTVLGDPVDVVIGRGEKKAVTPDCG